MANEGYTVVKSESSASYSLRISIEEIMPTDLAVTATASPEPVAAGGQLQYIIQVTNNGPGIAEGIVVTDILPAGVSVIGASTALCDGSSNKVTCSFDRNGVRLGVGDTQEVGIVVRPGASGTEVRTITNMINVVSSAPERDAANNILALQTTVAPLGDLNVDLVVDCVDVSIVRTAFGRTHSGGVDAADINNDGIVDIEDLAIVSQRLPAGTNCDADMSVSLRDLMDPVTLGETVAYSIHIVNNGPGVATAVTVTDFLPLGVEFVGSNLFGCKMSVGAFGNSVTCQLVVPDVLRSGESVDVQIQLRPTGATTITNAVNVRSSIPDQNGANNTNTETTTVIGRAARKVIDSPLGK